MAKINLKNQTIKVGHKKTFGNKVIINILDNPECSSSSTSPREPTYTSPSSKVTVTQKRQQEGKIGPKKDVVVKIPNFKSPITETKKVGALFTILNQRIKQLLLITTKKANT